MARLLFMFICLSPIFLVQSEVLQQNTPNTYTSEINAVLTHLNSSPFKIYNYKGAALLNAHKKSNITELSLDVTVECLNRYPDVPCSDTLLRCAAFVEGGHRVLNEVSCSPLETRGEDPVPEAQSESANDGRVIALSNEAVSSEVNEPFMAVRRDSAPCVGCPFDLSTNAEGVEELVGLGLEHVGSERANRQALVKIHRLQQQVVSGIKYILLVEFVNTVCPKGSTSDLSSCPRDTSDSFICEITYIQKPWISREKHIISNNCTTSQEFTRIDNKKNEISNEIDVNGKFERPESTSTDFERIAETGTFEEMSPSRLSDLESQILGMDDFIQTGNLQPQPIYASPTKEQIIDTTPLLEETTSALVEEVTTIVEDRSSEEESQRAKRSEESAESQETNSTSSGYEKSNSTESEESKEDSHERFRSKRAIPQLEKISPEEKGLVKNLADFAAAASDKIDDDNHRRVVLQILGAKKMIGDDGVYYHLIMRLGISRCLEDKAYPYEDCREKLFEDYTKICKVLVFVDEDYANPKVVKSQCQNIKKDKNDSNRTNYSRFKRQTLKGGQKTIDKDSENVKDLTAKGIEHFNLQSEKQNKAKPIEIISATSQVVAGVAYEIKVKVADSDCTKNDQKELEQCKVLIGSTPKVCTINVWEKSWENFRQFKISCEGDQKIYKVDTKLNRKRRSAPGGEFELDKTDKELLKYIEDTLTHLDEKSTHENKYKVHKIVKATNQVVAGTIYRADVEIVVSDCKKSDSKKRDECGALGSAEPKTCKFVVAVQHWIENSGTTNVTCGEEEHFFTGLKSQNQNIKKDKNDSNRIKRQAVIGGQSAIDKDSEKVKDLTAKGMEHFNLQSGKQNKAKPIEIISATSQVVAGVAYEIKVKVADSDCTKNDQKELEQCKVLTGSTPKVCTIKVWEKSWENFRQFKISCEGDQKIYKVDTKLNRKRRSAPGGEFELDKTDKELLKYIEDTLTHLDEKSTHENKYKVHKIVKATNQVVAGTIYRADVEIVVSDCKKSDSKKRDECGALGSAAPKTCKFVVTVQHWSENSPITNVTCGEEEHFFTGLKSQNQNIKKDKNDSNRIKRQAVIGGQSAIDKNSENVKDLTAKGIEHFNLQSGKQNKVKHIEIISATSQVVAGVAYEIKVKVADSDCTKNDHKELEQCNVLTGSTPKVCTINVWEKSWENFRQFKISCEGDQKIYKVETKLNRKRRSAPGGEFELDKTDKELLKYIEDTLTHLDKKSTHENKYKVYKIVKATNQVVAGMIYRADVEIVVSDCKKSDSKKRDECGALGSATPKKCNFAVTVQHWIENSRTTNVTCGEEEHFFTGLSVRRKRSAVGREYQIPKDDQFVTKYLEASLKQLDAESTELNKHKVEEVVSVTKQVVAGHTYKITAKVTTSECSKNDLRKRNECKTLQNSPLKMCKFEIYESLWIPNSRTIDIDCDLPKNRRTSYSSIFRKEHELTKMEFDNFIKKYNKQYSNKEYKFRLKVFSDNLLNIQTLNSFEQGTATYGVTQFADMTQDEFSKTRGLRRDLRNENETPFAQAPIPDIEIPTEFDWRKRNTVTEVKNQEQCGSCWAFSVTGNIEGQYAIKHGNLLEFSEQELVDCDTEDQGCNGGLMDTAYREIEQLGGLETEQDYPYDAEDEKCHFNKTMARVQLSGAVNISQDEGDMAKWLVANGPISIAINANAMQFYMGGISHPYKVLCNPKNLDHGVLIVGYGVHTYPLFNRTLPYWIVKNSWGTSWGEQGYYRVYRGDGTCGLNQTPSSAIVV